MKRLYMLVGVPGSGKSTWLGKNNVSEANVHSTDDIIEMFAASEGKTYNEVFGDRIGDASYAFEYCLQVAFEAGEDIYIDRTNLSKKVRKKFLDMARQYGYLGPDNVITAVVFETPESTEWVRRLESRPGKSIPAHVLSSMASSFEEPTRPEGFNCIIKV